MPKYKVTDIQWDTDEESQDELGFPTEDAVECENEDEVIDILANEYGWCVVSCCII